MLEHLGFVYARDVDYLELTGDPSKGMESPIVPLYMLPRDKFAPGNAAYRAVTG